MRINCAITTSILATDIPRELKLVSSDSRWKPPLRNRIVTRIVNQGSLVGSRASPVCQILIL